jgi:hypothetical protein
VPDIVRSSPQIRCCDPDRFQAAVRDNHSLGREHSRENFYEEGGVNSHLTALLLDELAVAKVEDLHLPMPNDARLRKMVDLMIVSPADRSTLEIWAKRVGMSVRTLLRLISRETGMSFGRCGSSSASCWR